MEQKYKTKDTKEVFFANDTRVTRKYIPTQEEFTTQETMLAAFATQNLATVAYEVQAGDDLDSIATATGMDVAELRSLNDMGKARGSEDLAVGQLLNTKQEVSLLKVCTVDEVTELRTIASPVREVENSTMYEGDRKVLVRGTDGTERVQLHVTSVNGQVAYEEVLSSAILQEATETRSEERRVGKEC